jgi:hypothetical protein
LQKKYRKYLKKITTRSGHSVAVNIHKCECADELSFVHPYLCARDAVMNLEVHKFSLIEDRGDTDDKEFLQAV